MLKLKMAIKNGIQINVVFQEESSGGYSVFVPSLPGCISEGETFEEAKSNIIEAISLYIEDLNKEELKEVKSLNSKALITQVEVPLLV